MTINAELRTIADLTDHGLARNTTGIACATKRNGAWIETSVDTFRDKIEQFALGLYDLGVRHGDRVALHAENSAEWLIVDQAVVRLGAVTVPIYPTQPSEQVRHILQDSEARVYVVSTEPLLSPLESLLPAIATLETTIGILGSYRDSMPTFDDVIDRGKRRRAAAPHLPSSLADAVTPDDMATLAYTSGTTGPPKGVMLTHDNIVFDTVAASKSMPFDLELHRGGVVLSYLPLSHAYERVSVAISLFVGYPIYFIEDISEIADDLQTVRPVYFASVPRLLEKVHAGIKARADRLSGLRKFVMLWAIGLAERYDVETSMGVIDRLRYAVADRLVFKKIRSSLGGNLVAIISGGAALSPVTMRFFNGLGVFCGQGYGMTEASPVIATTKPGVLRPGSVGQPLDGVEVAIANDGEILTRGRHVMKGYYKLPEQTAEVITADGWLKTGDIGRLDKDNCLYITDRKKELLKLSTGKYVAPAPIETALGGSSFIEHVVVVGEACKFCSALVVLDVPAVRAHLDEQVGALPDAELPTHAAVLDVIQDQIRAVNADLPHWEQIKTFRLLANPFSIDGGELTPTLKIKRRVVQQKYRSQIETMYR